MIKKTAFILLLIVIQLSAQHVVFVKFKNAASKNEAVSLGRNLLSNKLTNRPVKSTDINTLAIPEKLQDATELNKIVKYNFASEAEMNNFISAVKNENQIEYVQTNNVYKVDSVPNDEFVEEQWGLYTTNAFDAWDITEGSDDVLLAVIDTGIDYLHPELSGRMFINSAEDINGNGRFDLSDINGIDEDGNGYTDDIGGFDFTDRNGFPFDTTGGDYLDWDGDPMDEQSHGTNVTGIIAAETNNGVGVAGVMPKGKVLTVKAFDPLGFGEEDDVAAAILYAVGMGADVINMSFGDVNFSYVLKDVIEYAYSKGVVMVASSGNSGVNTPHYPSGYSEVICVGYSNQSDLVNSGSNYGSTLDLVAPGNGILTTDLTKEETPYAAVTGTSSAAPFVSAAAALVLSTGNFTPEEVKQILKSSADDINSTGWDERSGAGRLNILKAVQVPTASKIKINTPKQDYATTGDSITVNASILSSSFQSYSLYLGVSYNPEEWTTLLEGIQNQFSNEDIIKLPTQNLEEGTYTLRLEVNLIDGRTTEERVSFHIIRNAPQVGITVLGPAYYGDKLTILSALYTDQLSYVKMYYRKVNESDFNFITLDGLKINNKFVGETHFGFIPKHIVEQNTQYEIYFEAVNLVGLTTRVDDNGGYYTFSTENNFELKEKYVKDYSLPAGNIHNQAYDFNGDGNIEVISNEFPEARDLAIYNYNGAGLEKVTSLVDKLPVTVADFNSDGKADILSNFSRKMYIDSQNEVNEYQFSTTDSNATQDVWTYPAFDIDQDGNYEVMGIYNETQLYLTEIRNDLTFDSIGVYNNPTEAGDGNNVFGYPTGTYLDFDNNGSYEFWTIDSDGDIIGMESNGNNSITEKFTITTNITNNDFYITSGDYNGDGREDLAVLLHSLSDYYIAPFYVLTVYTFNNGELERLYDRIWADPSDEFASSTFRTIKYSLQFADTDNDGKQELLTFMFPYAYLFDYKDDGSTAVNLYEENINTDDILVADIDGNGVMDISLPTDDGTNFIELSMANKPSVPILQEMYSTDETNVKVKVYFEGQNLLVYRSENETDFTQVATESSQEFTVGNHELNKTYYYRFVAEDNGYTEPQSAMSNIYSVYHHKPAEIDTVIVENSKNIEVVFTDKMNKTIDNLGSFEIVDFGVPSSITASAENKYLLTFEDGLVANETYTLNIDNIKDVYGSVITGGNYQVTIPEVTSDEELFITSFEVLDGNNIKINFSLEVERSTATVPENYAVTPITNYVTDVVAADDNKSVTITLKNRVLNVGREFKINLENIYSSVATGSILINEGAGSNIVVAGFAESLDDIFVYPNPCKITANDSKITFANLTNRAKIIIFTLSGKKVIELEEKDGDGGLDWDMRDERGEVISSGVYVYMVKALNDSGEEVQTKLEKFAVVK